jgi:hypothetical protein
MLSCQERKTISLLVMKSDMNIFDSKTYVVDVPFYYGFNSTIFSTYF